MVAFVLLQYNNLYVAIVITLFSLIISIYHKQLEYTFLFKIHRCVDIEGGREGRREGGQKYEGREGWRELKK